MTSNVVPLPFQGDLIDYLKLKGRQIEWLWRDGEAYIPVRPICDVLKLNYPSQYRKLTGPNSDATVIILTTVGADGKGRDMLCVAYPDFMIWLGGIGVGKVKEEARAPLIRLKAEIKLLIASFYRNRLFGEIAAYRRADEKVVMDYVARRPIRSRIVQAVANDWDFETLWRSTSKSRPNLVEEVSSLFRLGIIERMPDGMPSVQPDLFEREA